MVVYTLTQLELDKIKERSIFYLFKLGLFSGSYFPCSLSWIWCCGARVLLQQFPSVLFVEYWLCGTWLLFNFSFTYCFIVVLWAYLLLSSSDKQQNDCKTRLRVNSNEKFCHISHTNTYSGWLFTKIVNVKC